MAMTVVLTNDIQVYGLRDRLISIVGRLAGVDLIIGYGRRGDDELLCLRPIS